MVFPAPVILSSVSHTANQFVMQLHGQPGIPYVVQSSTNLTTWTPVSTNTPASTNINVTNTVTPSLPQQYWRASWQLP
jgi:hypothetical protein